MFAVAGYHAVVCDAFIDLSYGMEISKMSGKNQGKVREFEVDD